MQISRFPAVCFAALALAVTAGCTSMQNASPVPLAGSGAQSSAAASRKDDAVSTTSSSQSSAAAAATGAYVKAVSSQTSFSSAKAIAVPNGTSAGDCLIDDHYQAAGYATTVTAPKGFSTLAGPALSANSSAISTDAVTIYAHTVAAGDPSSYTWTPSKTNVNSLDTLVDVGRCGSLSAAFANAAATGKPAVAPRQAVAANELALVFFNMPTGSASSPALASPSSLTAGYASVAQTVTSAFSTGAIASTAAQSVAPSATFGTVSGTYQVAGVVAAAATATSAPTATPAVSGYAEMIPDAATRAFSSTSPFNTPVAASPALDPNSGAIVTTALADSGGTLGTSSVAVYDGLQVNAFDSTFPYVIGRSTDPLFTIACTEPWGPSGSTTCTPTGVKFHAPVGVSSEMVQRCTMPFYGQSGYSRTACDHHLAIVDSTTGTEYDGWQCDPPHGNGGTITCSWAGMGSTTSTGMTGFAATHGDIALRLGTVRPVEIAAGQIDHALAVNVSCVENPGYAPIAKSSTVTCSTANAPHYGTHFWWDLTSAQTASAAPSCNAYVTTVMGAWHTYGGYVTDTNGSGGLSAGAMEGDGTYTAMGLASAWKPILAKMGLARNLGDGPSYVMSFACLKPIIAAHLHVLAHS